MKNRYDSEQTIEDILDVATRLFATKGYEKTSIQDIVNGLDGLTRGAIYHHFSSKEDILIAVIRKMLPSSDYLEEFINVDGNNGREKLESLILNSLITAHTTTNEEGLELLQKNPRILFETFHLTNEFIAPKVEELLKLGNSDGSLNIKNTREVSQVVLLLVDGWFSSVLYSYTDEEFMIKVRVLQQALSGLGIKVFDAKHFELLEHLKTKEV